jgi:membrane-bound lytic murein transglycosylase A
VSPPPDLTPGSAAGPGAGSGPGSRPGPWRALALLAFGAWLATLAFYERERLAARWAGPEVELGRTAADPPPPAPPDQLVLRAADFAALPGFERDDLAGAATALARSCGVWLAKRASDSVVIADQTLPVARFQAACRTLAAVPADDRAGLRAALERAFVPWAARNGERWRGLFTGYYEPLLYGSRRRSERYRYPLLTRPADLVAIDLSAFRPEWKGIRIGGRFVDGSFLPFPDRAAIDGGALAGRGLELVWVDDAVDAFFLHIQGSGRVALAEGGTLRVGYAAQNGHPYVAIGKVLVERGELTRSAVSMQAIRRWLATNPARAGEVLAANPSYVFFRSLGEAQGTLGPEDGPLGSQGVPLVAGRSLAVDRAFVPLGVPLWLDGLAPGPVEGAADTTLRRLLVAQDTGGAIRGPLRGDVFFGFGDEAADLAGRMKHPGRLWLLLPR